MMHLRMCHQPRTTLKKLDGSGFVCCLQFVDTSDRREAVINCNAKLTHGRACYIITFINNYSCLLHVKLLKKKSNA